MTFSSTAQYDQFGLVARANSAAGSYYLVETDRSIGRGLNGSLTISTMVGSTQTTLANISLASMGGLNLSTNYNLKFLVQTVNSTTTELDADVWAQGTTDPGWLWPMGSVIDTTAKFNGSGSNSSGYDGIYSNPTLTAGAATYSNYIESVTPSDLPEINNFTSSPKCHLAARGW